MMQLTDHQKRRWWAKTGGIKQKKKHETLLWRVGNTWCIIYTVEKIGN